MVLIVELQAPAARLPFYDESSDEDVYESMNQAPSKTKFYQRENLLRFTNCNQPFTKRKSNQVIKALLHYQTS